MEIDINDFSYPEDAGQSLINIINDRLDAVRNELTLPDNEGQEKLILKEGKLQFELRLARNACCLISLMYHNNVN